MGVLRGRGSPRAGVRWVGGGGGAGSLPGPPRPAPPGDPLAPPPGRRRGTGATPGLDPGPGRLRPQEIAESLPHARKRAGVAGRRAAHDVDEPLDVAPEPPARDAESVVIAGLDRLALKDAHPEEREVDAGRDRELERAPEAAVHLHEPWGVHAVVTV